MDEVAENSDALMERYLEGEEISHEEIVHALEDGTDHGHIFPVTCGVATEHLGADRLLDAIVDDLPSPVQHGGLELDGHDARARPTDGEMFAYVFKTRADPFAGPHQPLPRLPGHARRTTRRCSTRAPTTRSASASCWCPQGKEVTHADAFGPGDIGAVAKLKETRAGDWLAARDQPISMPSIKLPGAGDGVRDRAEGQGRRGQGLHRAAPPAGGGPDDRPAPRRRRPASRSSPACRRSTSR